MSNVAAQGSIPVAADTTATATTKSAKILGRMEALPLSVWHLKARAIVGSATFFDAVDTVAIGMVLPVIGQAWHLTPGEIGWLISGGFLGQMIGAIGFGQLAERIGRIPTAMITTAIFALGGIASVFAVGFARHVRAAFPPGSWVGCRGAGRGDLYQRDCASRAPRPLCAAL